MDLSGIVVHARRLPGVFSICVQGAWRDNGLAGGVLAGLVHSSRTARTLREGRLDPREHRHQNRKSRNPQKSSILSALKNWAKFQPFQSSRNSLQHVFV